MFWRSLCLSLLTASSLLPAADWTVYLRRAGSVRIGMSLAEVRQALADPRARLEGMEVAECAYLRSNKLPRGLGLMFAANRIVRIDVRQAGIRTASGIGVGDSEDRIQRAYPGRIVVTPHHYLPDTGHYLTYSAVDASDKAYGMVFETEGNKVTSFRVGTVEAVGLVEGCS